MISTQPQHRSFSHSVIITLSFVGLLWLVHILAILNALDIWSLGISPKTGSGLVGVFLAPFIHGDWIHLATNTPSLIILGTILFYGYPRAALPAILGIWLASGLLTWVFARSGIVHYGASGLTHGLMFFLFTIGILRRDRLSIALSLVVFFLYGSMVWNVLPNDPNISFEMHLSGAIGGIVMAILLRKLDVAIARKHYDWEDDDDEDGRTLEDDLIEMSGKVNKDT